MYLHPRWFVLLVVLTAALTATAADWPTWRGPDRSGVSTETGLLKEWPKDGPKELWKATKMGGGYSTPSIAAGRIYLLGSRTGDEFLLALDDKDGKELWAARIGRVGRDGPPSYPGPRSSPAIDGDLVYVLGSDADLICATTEKGEVKWKKNLATDFGGSKPNWAWSESPLIDGDVLICSPGARDASIVALNKQDGSVIWKSSIPGGRAAYASAVVAEIGGVKQYVQFLAGGVVGVNAKDGKLLWEFKKTVPTGRGGGTVCTTPIVKDGYVFTTAGYGHGGGTAKVTGGTDGFAATEAYFSPTLANRQGNWVLIGDHLYGTNESSLMCIELKTGKKAWEDRSVGKGTVAAADGMIYLRSERGPVALVEATAAGYKEKGRFTPPAPMGGGGAGRPGGGGGGGRGGSAWATPVILNGKLYLRDADQLLCYDIKAQ